MTAKDPRRAQGGARLLVGARRAGARELPGLLPDEPARRRQRVRRLLAGARPGRRGRPPRRAPGRPRRRDPAGRAEAALPRVGRRRAALPRRAGGPTRRAPLGALFGARSGDKGGNANLGVWARSDAAYAWLAAFLTVERLKQLLPEAAPLEVRRFELPNLRALNFVVVGPARRGRGVLAPPRRAGEVARRVAARARSRPPRGAARRRRRAVAAHRPRPTRRATRGCECISGAAIAAGWR